MKRKRTAPPLAHPAAAYRRDGDTVLLVMPFGASVTLTGQSQNGFLSVSYNGSAGWASADYLATGRYERHLQRLRARCAEQVARLSQCVQDHFPEGTRLTRPQGGFVLWVELPGAPDTMALYDVASRFGVDFVPGAMFSASGRYQNCLRLNAGYPVTTATEAAIRRLGTLFAT